MKVKLCDFGMSKMKVSSTSSTKTKHTSLGTTRWRAPETFGKNPTWNEMVDIFALGMTFYEIFTFKVPFETESDNRFLHCIYFI